MRRTGAGDATKLVGSPAKRLRVGDYRILFEEDEQEIRVARIGPRGGIYDQGDHAMKHTIVTTPAGEELVLMGFARILIVFKTLSTRRLMPRRWGKSRAASKRCSARKK